MNGNLLTLGVGTNMDKMNMEVEMLPLNFDNMLNNEYVYNEIKSMFQEPELSPEMYLKLVMCAKKNGMKDNQLFMIEKEEYVPFDALANGDIEDSTEDM